MRALVLAACLTAVAAPAAQADGWHALVDLGLSAGGLGSPVEPLGGVRVGALVEHGWAGVEVSALVATGKLCAPSGDELEQCGMVSFSVAPRATFWPGAAFSPYLSLDAGTVTTDDTWPMLGGGLGVRYQGPRFGWYLEADASVILAAGTAGMVSLSTGVLIELGGPRRPPAH